MADDLALDVGASGEPLQPVHGTGNSGSVARAARTGEMWDGPAAAASGSLPDRGPDAAEIHEDANILFARGHRRLEERRARLRRAADDPQQLIDAIRAEENRGRVEILTAIAREHEAQLADLCDRHGKIIAERDARIAALERAVQLLGLRRQEPMVLGIARFALHGRS